jgi:hypothetical protein
MVDKAVAIAREVGLSNARFEALVLQSSFVIIGVFVASIVALSGSAGRVVVAKPTSACHAPNSRDIHRTTARNRPGHRCPTQPGWSRATPLFRVLRLRRRAFEGLAAQFEDAFGVTAQIVVASIRRQAEVVETGQRMSVTNHRVVGAE